MFFLIFRSEVFRIERELEEARSRLTAIRQAKYKLRGYDTSGDDTDGYISSAQDGETSRWVSGVCLTLLMTCCLFWLSYRCWIREFCFVAYALLCVSHSSVVAPMSNIFVFHSLTEDVFLHVQREGNLFIITVAEDVGKGTRIFIFNSINSLLWELLFGFDIFHLIVVAHSDAQALKAISYSPSPYDSILNHLSFYSLIFLCYLLKYSNKDELRTTKLKLQY